MVAVVVWRREKSLPNFYDKQPVKDESGSESSRKAGSEPSPNIVRYIRELSEQRKTVDTRQSVDTTQRYRSKLHPKADFSFEGRVVTEHQQDLIPSFITRHERTKTSIMASQGEENGTAVPGGTAAAAAAAAGSGVPAGTAAAAAASSAAPSAGGREVSNLLAAYTRDKPLHQESVCLKGGKLTGNLGRRPLHYLTPFSAYRQKQPWTVCGEENSPVRCSPRNAVSLSLSRGSGGVTSSSANGVAGRRDLVLSGSTFRAHDKFPLQPLRVGHHSPHKFNNKLGAAHDSLSLLSRHGAPTVVERNLSYDLELRMERCRRERSFAAIGETNVLSTAHYVAYDSQPTRGEVTLMRAREANKSRDGRTTYRRNGLQKPLHHNSPNMNFMLARAVDHNVSPRSRSDQGDSGIQSSAGDVADDAPRIGEHHPANNGIVFPRDLGDEVILEQPGDCDEHYDDTERSEFVWDAAQAMWVPAEMAQHVLESIQKANRDDRRAAEHAQGEDMLTDKDHSEVKGNESTILEHDTREDVAVLGTGSDADGIQEEVAPKELEKIASVSIVGAEQKDGFEDKSALKNAEHD
nr:hypothetical protein BaRGS_003524 [Batillaria attramentaria]